MGVIHYFCVAGHKFSLEMGASSDIRPDLENYSRFRTEAGEVIFKLKIVDIVDAVPMKQLYASNPKPEEQRIDLFSCKGGYIFELAPYGNIPVAGRLKLNPSFSDGILEIDPKYLDFGINNALMLMYAFSTACMGTLEMHASVTVQNGYGYLFLGKSGTGKSTHSALWLKHIQGTLLLNDDNPVVRIMDGKAFVYGTPWSGKTPCYKNEHYPVGAVVRLNQAPSNSVRRLTLPEALATVIASSSGFRAIKELADGLYATEAAIVTSVPFYSLDCLPDQAAAELCFSTVAVKS